MLPRGSSPSGDPESGSLLSQAHTTLGQASTSPQRTAEQVAVPSVQSHVPAGRESNASQPSAASGRSANLDDPTPPNHADDATSIEERLHQSTLLQLLEAVHSKRPPLPLDHAVASFHLRGSAADPSSEGGLEDAFTDAYSLLLSFTTSEAQQHFLDVMAQRLATTSRLAAFATTEAEDDHYLPAAASSSQQPLLSAANATTATPTYSASSAMWPKV